MAHQARLTGEEIVAYDEADARADRAEARASRAAAGVEEAAERLLRAEELLDRGYPDPEEGFIEDEGADADWEAYWVEQRAQQEAEWDPEAEELADFWTDDEPQEEKIFESS